MSKSRAEFDLHFSSGANSESYRLLELPSDLYKIIENGIEKECASYFTRFSRVLFNLIILSRFTIRGRSSDDAVLCTASKTYALRSIALSNTILLTSPALSSHESESETVEKLIVHDEISQLIELIPTAPKLQRLGSMLKGCEYDEGHEVDEEGSEEEERDGRPASSL